MYHLTRSLDFPVTAPSFPASEGWDDDYSDGSDDEASTGAPRAPFEDVQDVFGAIEPTHLTFGEAGFEDVGQSDDSDSDDETLEPLQFDDMPTDPNFGNVRKQPLTSCCMTPFWFGDEDSQHVHRLMQSYEKALGVEKERSRVLRGDLPFVGRVLRRQVLDIRGSDFLTIDAIDVYLNEQMPNGVELQPFRHVHALTRWDNNSGLPIDIKPITRKAARIQWKPLVRPGVSSWLLGMPHELAKSQFTYSTSRIECPMRLSNDKPFSYQQFIPKRPELDDDPNFMPCGSPGSSPQRPPPKFHFG